MESQSATSSVPVALKEWAVAIEALLEGKQIMLLRKGGIVEETRDFELLSPAFYLMPTFEHQKKGLLKPHFQGMLDDTLSGWDPGNLNVTLRAYGEVTEDIEIRDQETLDRLRDFHIWTDTFAEERLKWKRNKPLHLLLVRMYRLEQPTDIPIKPAYTGCKSWVKLEDELEMRTKIPVLGDSEFNLRVAQIKVALER
ncbi:DUF1802 family protein [Paenibacillus abyssi]|uniref:DUF1802 domain-containing protein n=1 Tax=Paenibacillus abyssi TaxID=1340531 RepID=A0A917LI89_9BACL|nr:DUF1802 family protein [Paenibacillus abyssi]GGG26222.1 hypothetical protein GCM10010916_48290 [Paenibacillus abyssi]